MSKKQGSAKSNRASTQIKAGKKTKKKTVDELMLEAWERAYANRQKDIERANKLLLRAWQKTYENRHHRLD